MTGLQGTGSGGAASVERLCRLAQVSRAAFYRQWHESVPRAEETALRDRVQRLCLANRYYGYRRIGALLRREGWCVNHKRLVRIMREDNLLCLRKPLFRPATTDSSHGWRVWPNLARHMRPMAVNQLWVADITYVAWQRRSSIWRWCSTLTAARSSVGRWRTICAPSSRWTHCKGRLMGGR